jgi:hypothetical protein
MLLYQLSAADAAPTAPTDPGDTFMGAVAAVGTLAVGTRAIAAAKRLSSSGPASTSGTHSAGSKTPVTCVLLAQLCSRGTATGDLPSKRPKAKSAEGTQPGQTHEYYEDLIRYDRVPAWLVRCCCCKCRWQRRRCRDLVESWGKTFTPPSFPDGWSAGKTRHRSFNRGCRCAGR